MIEAAGRRDSPSVWLRYQFRWYTFLEAPQTSPYIQTWGPEPKGFKCSKPSRQSSRLVSSFVALHESPPHRSIPNPHVGRPMNGWFGERARAWDHVCGRGREHPEDPEGSRRGPICERGPDIEEWFGFRSNAAKPRMVFGLLGFLWSESGWSFGGNHSSGSHKRTGEVLSRKAALFCLYDLLRTSEEWFLAVWCVHISCYFLFTLNIHTVQ